MPHINDGVVVHWLVKYVLYCCIKFLLLVRSLLDGSASDRGFSVSCMDSKGEGHVIRALTFLGEDLVSNWHEGEAEVDGAGPVFFVIWISSENLS